MALKSTAVKLKAVPTTSGCLIRPLYYYWRSVISVLLSVVCSYVLMQQCWNEDPKRRPSFAEIKNYLDEHLSADPAKPTQKDNPRRDNREAEAYRPGAEGHENENVEMRNLKPGAHLQRNDYLSLRQSIPADGYLSPMN